MYQPKGPIETTSCDFETVESVTDDLYTQLNDLVHTPFFKYFRVDLYRDCPFWQENGFCMNRECGITTVDEVRLRANRAVFFTLIDSHNSLEGDTRSVESEVIE